MEQDTLKRRVKAECRALVTRVRKGLQREKDLPSVVVACAMNDDIWCKIGYSGKAEIGDYTYVLRRALGELGVIGGISEIEQSNKIGYCAEPNAANKVLRQKRHNGRNIGDLLFSKSYRPRTRHTYRIPYCNNCKHIFNI